MPSDNKPLRYRLQNANASTLAKLLSMNAIKRMKQTSKQRAEEAVTKPVRKRVRTATFENDDTDTDK